MNDQKKPSAGASSAPPAGSVLCCQFCGNETPGEVVEKVLADTYHGDGASVRVIECINTRPCGERTSAPNSSLEQKEIRK